jgi:hypothetical protein
MRSLPDLLQRSSSSFGLAFGRVFENVDPAAVDRG